MSIDAAPSSEKQTTEIAFFQLPPDVIPRLWPVVSWRLEKGSVTGRASGRWSEESIYKNFATQKWQLWCAMEGKECLAIVATELNVHPTGMKSALIVMATGDARDKWERIGMEKIEQWAREEGCSLLEMWARPGWHKVFPEWRMTHIMLEKRL